LQVLSRGTMRRLRCLRLQWHLSDAGGRSVTRLTVRHSALGWYLEETGKSSYRFCQSKREVVKYARKYGRWLVNDGGRAQLWVAPKGGKPKLVARYGR